MKSNGMHAMHAMQLSSLVHAIKLISACDVVPPLGGSYNPGSTYKTTGFGLVFGACVISGAHEHREAVRRSV